MRSSKALLAVVMTCALLSAGLVLLTDDSGASGGVGVCVTLPWQKEMLERIGGDRLEVVQFVGPGSNPHGSDQDMGALLSASRSVAYLYVGSGVEWEEINLPKLRSGFPDMAFVNMSEGIELLPAIDDGHGHGPVDPHVWTSPANLALMAEAARDALVGLDPGNALVYEVGYQEYMEELGGVLAVADSFLSGRDGERFLVWHSAWRYLCHDYGLVELPLERPYSGELTLGDLQEVLESIREEGIERIFVKPDDPLWESSSFLTQRGIVVVVANPLAVDYLEELRGFIIGLSESWE